MRRLKSLSISASVIENSTLARLPDPTDLRISGAEIRPGSTRAKGQTNARKVTLEHLRDLTSLASLDFLQSIHRLSLVEIETLDDLTGIGQWQQTLRSLDVLGGQLTDISAVKQLPELEILSLSETCVTDVSPLRHLRQLTHLDLSATPVADISPLATLTKLEYLSLGHTNVSDITSLRRLSTLKELHIIGSMIRDMTQFARGAQMKWGTNSEVVAVHNPFAGY